MGENGKGAEG